MRARFRLPPRPLSEPMYPAHVAEALDSVKKSLVRLAGERRQSISQIVTVMLEEALRDLEPEPVSV